MRTPFYHGTIKKVIATFASLFKDLTITTDSGKVIPVPLHYAPKQKFLEVLAHNADGLQLQNDIALPVMGFEMPSMNYDAARMTNPLTQPHKKRYDPNNPDTVRYMYNSIPYDFNFELYIATNTTTDAFKVVEQILPFFTPNLTVTIKDNIEFDIQTNITFDLTAVSYTIEYEGAYTDKRTIQWQISFTAHAYIHSNPREINRIKEIIVNLSEKGFDEIYETMLGDIDNNGVTWK